MTRYVVAPSYQRFVLRCRKLGLNPHDPAAARYVRTMRDVLGVRLASPEQIIDAGGPRDLVLALRGRVWP